MSFHEQNYSSNLYGMSTSQPTLYSDSILIRLIGETNYYIDYNTVTHSIDTATAVRFANLG